MKNDGGEAMKVNHPWWNHLRMMSLNLKNPKMILILILSADQKQKNG